MTQREEFIEAFRRCLERNPDKAPSPGDIQREMGVTVSHNLNGEYSKLRISLLEKADFEQPGGPPGRWVPKKMTYPTKWLHCSPALVERGPMLCHLLPRRKCECDPRGSHDHLVMDWDALDAPSPTPDDELMPGSKTRTRADAKEDLRDALADTQREAREAAQDWDRRHY